MGQQNKVSTVTFIPEVFEILANPVTGKVIVFYSIEINETDKETLRNTLASLKVVKRLSQVTHENDISDEYSYGYVREVWQ